MKKISPLILLFSFSIIYAQTAYIGAGYNLSNGSFDKFNFVIDRYNETREDLNLDPEMENINLMHGASFEFGIMIPYFLFGLGFQYDRAKSFAQLIDDNNIKQQRDLWLRTFNMAMDVGLALGAEGFIAAPGVGLNFMFHRYLTRSGPANKIDDMDFYEPDSEMTLQAKIFIKFIFGGMEDPGLGLMIEPFYNLGMLGSSMFYMNRDLNPQTYLNDPTVIDENFTHYGLRLLIILRTG